MHYALCIMNMITLTPIPIPMLILSFSIFIMHMHNAYMILWHQRIKSRFKLSCATFVACLVEPSKNRLCEKILILLIFHKFFFFENLKNSLYNYTEILV